ncbi:MAG: superoxide dismutase, Ni [Candidatus Levybacteria bacterium RIFCSPLOWO2_01_FULL_39_24]|nr:MAG: superoxide dismutase, Ni [Candidatus Levybacteria bacterium RIFCSPHIGHO2_01_FULL_40_16]OGH27950.1 MAG: superoxide dismutase, Ni [Candidatus Levybacteria bacterium RIFCSPHIGHO2_12_FULL_39_9]OGH46757.1 MAG: superoxide dismutase, Ni [Candidatus Levybacteria bacterium RIFCSPLOWO2_01_FULL_39_24]
MILRSLFFEIFKILPTKTAYAHCDVPCGIYDPKPAQIAASTVLKMVQLIQDLPMQNLTINDRNKFVRCVLTKEEHARKCKEELLILWTDYFKPEHLAVFPKLHDTFWKAAKLCSKNKQEVNIESAQELVKAVDEISQIFQKAKSAAPKK